MLSQGLHTVTSTQRCHSLCNFDCSSLNIVGPDVCHVTYLSGIREGLMLDITGSSVPAHVFAAHVPEASTVRSLRRVYCRGGRAVRRSR